MTTAESLRADQRAAMASSGDGLPVSVALPAANRSYNPATGAVSGGDPPATLTGIGRISRFSDTIAAGGLIDDADSLIVLIPDEDCLGLTPANESVVSVTLEDSGAQQFRVRSWTPRYLAAGIVNFRIQARR